MQHVALLFQLRQAQVAMQAKDEEQGYQASQDRCQDELFYETFLQLLAP